MFTHFRVRFAERSFRSRGVFAAEACLALLLSFVPAGRAVAQDITEDMVGQDQKTWVLWSGAMRAIERDKADEAMKLLEGVAKAKPSDLRLALMADHSGTLRFEQAVETNSVGATGKALMGQIKNGRRQRQLAEDGWHFAAIGRFDYADANFKALVDSNPDPVALLEVSRYNPARTTTLIKLVASADVGESAKKVLGLLQEGERQLYTDPREIEVNVERLGGTPGVVYQATNNLKLSGEYAIPHLIAYLQNPKKKELGPAIEQLLPAIGRAAVNPLVAALDMKDQVTKQVLVRVLGAIGYKQAAPYLSRLSQDAKASAAVRNEATAALGKLGVSESNTAALFVRLGNDFYSDAESLRADPRYNTANVWYFEASAQELRNDPVPREIFNDISTMRCAEAALNLSADNADAMAEWLAANFRRESKLGMDVESEHATPMAAKDGTKPEGYPRAIYFARAAGPRYNHMVLARACHDRDAGVALGAIAALSATAGPSDLVGPEDFKQSLTQALTFPSRAVRTKAALAVGRSLPQSDFVGSQNVIPVLSEALGASTHRTALLVDPKPQSLNQMQGVLWAAGFVVVSDARLFGAQEQARKQKAPSIDAVFLASDMQSPGLSEAVAHLRGDFETAAVPIVIVTKKNDTTIARAASHSARGVETLLAEALTMGDAEKTGEAVQERLNSASRVLGMTPLDSKTALSLALQAADVLRLLAVNRNSIFDISSAEGALVQALAQPDESLRNKAASVLAMVGSPSAQQAIGRAALDEKNSETQRIAAFGSLAESARQHGNKLAGEQIQRLVKLVKDEKNLDLRTAGSQALGALNLRSNDASAIIRAQARG